MRHSVQEKEQVKARGLDSRDRFVLSYRRVL